MTIAKEHVDTVCRPGRQDGTTCAFLALHPESSWICVKETPIEALIRSRLAEGTMNARGDNCPGWSET